MEESPVYHSAPSAESGLNNDFIDFGDLATSVEVTGGAVNPYEQGSF